MGKNKNSSIYDILIVGAGAIGSALALKLSQLNYKVALLDFRAPSYHSTNPERVIALSEGSSLYLKSLGVWGDISDLGVGHIKNILVCEPNNKGEMQMSHSEINADALGYVLEMQNVLQPLHKALEGQVDVICPARCLSMQHTSSGVTLQIETDQGQQTLQTKLLVGADGTQSLVRKMADIQTAGWDHNRMGIVASIQTELGHGDVAYECFRQEGPLALLPLADGRFSLVWSVAPKHGVSLMKLDDKSFLEVLEKEVGMDVLAQVGAFQSLGRRATFPLEFRIAKAYAKEGVVLVGNAAHTIHPIAGQGMNLGFRDGIELANILDSDWARKDFSSPRIVQAYAEKRRVDILAVSCFTEGVLEVFGLNIAPARWLRGQGLNILGATPSLKQLLLQQAAGLGQLKGMKL